MWIIESFVSLFPCCTTFLLYFWLFILYHIVPVFPAIHFILRCYYISSYSFYITSFLLILFILYHIVPVFPAIHFILHCYYISTIHSILLLHFHIFIVYYIVSVFPAIHFALHCSYISSYSFYITLLLYF